MEPQEVKGSYNYIKRDDNVDINDKRARILRIFPFESLTKNNPLEYELTMQTSVLLTELTKSAQFQSNVKNCISYTFIFCLQGLYILYKHEDSSDVLIQLLVLLNSLVKTIHKEVQPFWVRILGLTKILDTQYNNVKIRVLAFDIFQSLFRFVETKEQFTLICTELAEIFDRFKLENDIEKLAIIAANVLNYSEKKFISQFSKIYKWIETGIVPLLTTQSIETVQSLFNILILVYYKPKLPLNRQNITKTILENFTVLLGFFENSTLHKAVVQFLSVFVMNIKHVLLLHPVYTHDYVCKFIQCLPAKYLDWVKTTNDIFYILAYLCSNYGKVPWSNINILDSISLKISRGFITDPVLKCLCYLASKYTVPDFFYKATVTKPLFQLVKTREDIGHILTFNVEQLQWIFEADCYALRKVVFQKWVKLGKTNEDIEKVLLLCNVNDLVVDVIQLYYDLPSVKRIVNIIRKSENKHISLLIEKSILNSVDSQSLGHLFKVLQTVSNDRQIVLQMCRKLPYFLRLVDDYFFKYVVTYAFKLMTKQQNDLYAIHLFFQDIRVIFKLIKMSRKADNVSVIALKLVNLLLFLQVKHSINIVKIPINLQKYFDLNLSEEKAEVLVDLIIIILRNQKRGAFLYINTTCHHFDTYHMLMQISHISFFDKIIECLTILIRLQPHLAYSNHTIAHVSDILCTNTEVLKQPMVFMVFLLEWLKNFKQSYDHRLPVKTLGEFVYYQKKCQLKVDLQLLLAELNRKNLYDYIVPWN